MKLRALLIIMSLTISMIPLGIIAGFQGIEIASASLGLILGVIFFISFIIAYLITLPIQKLTKNIDEISRGNLEVELEKSGIYEINKLINSLKRVMVSLKLAIYKVGMMKEDIFEETVKEKNTVESRYTSLLKVVDGWIWEIDSKGIWQFCSEKIYDSLGYQSTEIVGKNIFNYLENKDKIKLKKMLKKYITKSSQDQNQPTIMDLNFHHKSGENVLVNSSFIPFYDESYDFLGFRGMNRLTSNIPQKEVNVTENLKDSKSEEVNIYKKDISRFTNKNLTVSSNGTDKFDYSFLFDNDTKIIDCSENMPLKLGYDKTEILSLTLDEIDCFENKENIKNKLDKIKNLGKMTFKTMYRKKDKGFILVNETICYLKKKDLFECSVKEETITNEI